MRLRIPPGQGHNVWDGFFQCQELVEFVIAHASPAAEREPSAALFQDPPIEVRPGGFWDWLNGNVDLDRMTCELEEMKAKGMPGAEIRDIGVICPFRSTTRPKVPTVCRSITRRLPVLTKLETLVRDGATLLGPKPEHDASLADYTFA